MKSVWRSSCVVLMLAAAGVVGLRAEVKTAQKSQVKFEGTIGRVMGMFGGKAAKEGLVSNVAVKGNRKMIADEYTGQIIDLDEEKVYSLDMRKKNYEVVTFEEMRRRMKEAEEKASESMKQAKDEQQPEGKQMEVDFSLKESGQKKTVNGYDCREVIMSITAREKGKTLEQSGGMVLTSNMWLGPKIDAMKEIEDFDLRYAKALAGPLAGVSTDAAQQMAAALALYPAMKDMMGKMQAEKVNMDGTPVLTVTTIETVRGTEQAAKEQEEPKEEKADMTSLGGIGGFLGKKAFGKKQAAQGQPSNRSTVMTMNHELVSVSTSVAATDLQIPAGFKEKK